MSDIAALDPVPIRDVWPNEAKDLTPWLADNSQLLSDALGMDLELEGQEVAVGQFSADLVFRDVSSDSRVVVENLISPTDHDHLGKLITYSAGLDAKYAVLLAESFRPEHRSALTWLNSVSEDGFGFFGLSLEVWRIGDSAPAPRLRVDVQPDDWHRTVRAASGWSEVEREYFGFWSEFLPEFHDAHSGWGRAREKPTDWFTWPSVCSGVTYVAKFLKVDGTDRLRVEVKIETNAQSRLHLFDQMYEHKAKIESAIGEELDWDRSENAPPECSITIRHRSACVSKIAGPRLGRGLLRRSAGCVMLSIQFSPNCHEPSTPRNLRAQPQHV